MLLVLGCEANLGTKGTARASSGWQIREEVVENLRLLCCEDEHFKCSDCDIFNFLQNNALDLIERDLIRCFDRKVMEHYYSGKRARRGGGRGAAAVRATNRIITEGQAGTGTDLFVEPHVFHARAAEDAVDHDR
jgi:hypothetical protein